MIDSVKMLSQMKPRKSTLFL